MWLDENKRSMTKRPLPWQKRNSPASAIYINIYCTTSTTTLLLLPFLVIYLRRSPSPALMASLIEISLQNTILNIQPKSISSPFRYYDEQPLKNVTCWCCYCCCCTLNFLSLCDLRNGAGSRLLEPLLLLLLLDETAKGVIVWLLLLATGSPSLPWLDLRKPGSPHLRLEYNNHWRSSSQRTVHLLLSLREFIPKIHTQQQSRVFCDTLQDKRIEGSIFFLSFFL